MGLQVHVPPSYQLLEIALNVLLIFNTFFSGLSGDTDGRVPVLSTRYCLSTLKLPITRAWRPWYHQQQVIPRLKYVISKNCKKKKKKKDRKVGFNRFLF